MTRRLVPEYIENLKLYQAGKPIEELAKEKDLTRISKLASNENPLGPSPFAIKEMTNSLWEVHRYPDMNATFLKNELSILYNVKPTNIILSSGSEGIMGYIARAFIQPGDEILTSENTFIGFHILMTGAGAKIVTAPRTKDLRYDVKELARKVNENTKVLYIANPDNPTGTYITKEEFDYLMEHVPEHTIVILDEAYFEFAKLASDYPDSMSYRYDNVITLRTFSKAYGIAGIRIGYGLAQEKFIEALHKVKPPFEPSLIAQHGAIGALKDYPHLERTIKNNTKRYMELMKFFEKKGFHAIPSVTNFVCFRLNSPTASSWFYEELLNLGVILRPLKLNNMETWLRISIGTKEEMNHFYESVEKILPTYIEKFGFPK